MARTTVDKLLLSGSTNGRRILVAATATPGTLIHTATSASDEVDWVTIYAFNAHTSDVVLTLEWGGTTDPDDRILETIQTKGGDTLVISGLPLKGGVVVRAFAGTASKVTIGGFVERAKSE